MLSSRTATNMLLLLVVLFLALIAAKVYRFDAVAEAGDDARVTASSAMVGCYRQGPFADCKWRYVRVSDDGILLRQ
jgi:hypothetical protein